jgi:hypothetical protein
MDCVRWDVGYWPITSLELEWHRQRNGAATDIAFSLKVDYFRFGRNPTGIQDPASLGAILPVTK